MDDHGTFLIPEPDDCGRMVSELFTRAAVNDVRPGHAWSRLLATRRVGGRKVEGIRMWHLDLERGVLEVTETWGGEETARHTRELPQG